MQEKVFRSDADPLNEGDENDLDDEQDAEIKKLLSDHFDFTELIRRLPNLEELHLVYGVKGCGMNFDWNMFEFTKKDCQILSRCVQQCQTLRVLHLHRSKLDDIKVRMLIRDGLLDHPGLVELDLENNQIGDRTKTSSSFRTSSPDFSHRWMSSDCQTTQRPFDTRSIESLQQSHRPAR